jgi:hypothetical protein
VQTFNTRIQSFPGVVLAGPFGFSKREFFEIENAGDREPVSVSFSQPPTVAEAPAAPVAPAAPEAPPIPPSTPPAIPPTAPGEPGDASS